MLEDDEDLKSSHVSTLGRSDLVPRVSLPWERGWGRSCLGWTGVVMTGSRDFSSLGSSDTDCIRAYKFSFSCKVTSRTAWRATPWTTDGVDWVMVCPLLRFYGIWFFWVLLDRCTSDGKQCQQLQCYIIEDIFISWRDIWTPRKKRHT